MPPGWNANKPSTLKAIGAEITMNYGVDKGFPAPKGVKVSQTKISGSEKMKDNAGRTAEASYELRSLVVTDAKGKKVTLQAGDKPEAVKKQFLEDWRSSVKGYSKDDIKNYSPMLNYSTDSSFQGFGTAGSMMSVVESGSAYEGGAHPNNFSALETFDVRTGKQVELDSLVSAADFKKICNSVKNQLKTLKGKEDAEGIDGTTFGGSTMSDKDIADAVKKNFALSTDKNGKTTITIGWESGVHAMGPMMALFKFDAPSDAAFKAKIGAQ